MRASLSFVGMKGRTTFRVPSNGRKGRRVTKYVDALVKNVDWEHMRVTVQLSSRFDLHYEGKRVIDIVFDVPEGTHGFTRENLLAIYESNQRVGLILTCLQSGNHLELIKIEPS